MNTSATLQVDLGGLIMKNPVTVASGTFGSGREYADLWKHTQETARGALEQTQETALSVLGAVTTKGVSFKPWAGNSGTRIAETASGMLNSIGLQNPGVEVFCSDDLSWLASQNVPVIVNVSGHTADEYAQVIERLEQECAVSAYEINISCPNVACGGMSFGTDPVSAEEVTTACRQKTLRPLIVKLSPNVTDITEIARAAEAAGGDALSLINTVAGMSIDVKTRSTVFERGMGGLSGPAIKPVALYAVHRVYKAVDIPILGMGGIRNAEDAVEFLLAGARAVAVGTAHFLDPYAALTLIQDLEKWCAKEGVKDINELTGALH